MKEKILVSSCLCGNKVKYNGQDNYQPLIEELKQKYDLILICPEVMGGLGIPRNPSEIKDNKVIMNNGRDVTCNYKKGARMSLEIAIKNGCKKALLKEKSPSCGSHSVYDGNFNGTLIRGQGITTKLLASADIKIYSEDMISELLKMD